MKAKEELVGGEGGVRPNVQWTFAVHVTPEGPEIHPRSKIRLQSQA